MDYTGTCFTDTLGYDPITVVQKVYDTVVKDFNDKYDLAVLDQTFNNTYTLAMLPERAKELNVKTISDLARVSQDLVIPPYPGVHQARRLPPRASEGL